MRTSSGLFPVGSKGLTRYSIVMTTLITFPAGQDTFVPRRYSGCFLAAKNFVVYK
jgi:hypothetical protein